LLDKYQILDIVKYLTLISAFGSLAPYENLL